MITIKKVINEEMANECDNLLTKLIQSERKYDGNIKDTFIVKDNYKKMLDKDYFALFIAYDNITPVGYIYGYQRDEEGEFVFNSTGNINALYTDEDYRNKGIAKALINRFYEWCKSKNIRTIEISVFKSNIPAYELYKNQGFEIESYRMKKSI